MSFLPLSSEEAKQRGWDEVDFVCVTGDAYVDHPSFGVAIISRLLESLGFRVGILSQPVDEHFKEYGKPRLGFMVTSGCIDSMVAHYTAAKRKRSDDAYTPGGKSGKRPDRAVDVYCKIIRKTYGDIPIIIGGLEASLRRFAHYDYWADKVLPSILVSSGANLLTYGMGEHQTEEIAKRLNSGQKIENIHDVRGTCFLTNLQDLPLNGVSCASYEKVGTDKISYAKAYKTQAGEQDYIYGKPVIQKHGDKLLIQNPPSAPLNTKELDRTFALPYMRTYHPSYEKYGGIKAIEEVQFSINHNRGCFGACNFCSISFHQGRQITCRSEESIMEEAKKLTQTDGFKGYIHDVGGPTANFRSPSCEKQLTYGVCREKKCLAPTPCPNLRVEHKEYVGILKKLREIKGVKKVFVRSGLRYDYMLQDKDDTFITELIQHHISGQLKVAPEHCSAAVLDKMGKPHIAAYEKFSEKFYKITKKAQKEQYLVPYLMSSHPGSTLRDAVKLALFLKKHNIRPEQVQDFYPTPGTASTTMFYTGLDPITMEKVYVPKTPEEKQMQRALLQYFKPENRHIVKAALIKAKREDLIGKGGLISAYEQNKTNIKKDK